MNSAQSDNGFSVLMSCYAGSDANDLHDSLTSLYSQSLLPNDIVLVLDGPVSEEIESVISEFAANDSVYLDVVRLPKNVGLGLALNEGIKHCRYDTVARMDADDICSNDRFAKQFRYFAKHPELTILSSYIYEFKGSPFDKTGEKRVPLKHDSIIKYSRKRNPFNHPSVMFSRDAVDAAGGYTEDYHLFEDYDLWIRMLKNGAKSANLDEHLVYMRTTDDIYLRRGGKAYANDMLRFHKHLNDINWSTKWDYTTGAIPHYLVCIMPNWIRKIIYKILH